MSLKNIADEIAISEEDDYGDEGYDDYDDTYDDQSDNAKTTSKKLSQSSPAKMRSSSGKNNTFSMSIEDAAEALRNSSDQTLFGRLFTQKLSIRNSSGKNKKKQSAKEHRKKIDEMARPRQRKKNKLKFASEDDEKNCTFNSTLKKKRHGEQKKSDGESKEGGVADFTVRMEAKERARRQKLERKRGEKEYESLIDKKVCPKCGAVQSYDEVVSRRNKCKKSGCNCLYRKPNIKDSSVFLKRLERMEEANEKKKKILSKKYTPKFQPEHRIMFDPTEGKVVKLPYQNRSRDWEGFLARMKDAENKRKNRMLQGGANESTTLATKSAMF